MDTLISKCDGKKVVLQVDFSENGTIAGQNESKSAHWCHRQATLFTVYAWIKEDENERFVLLSYDLTHTKYSVYTFMEYIMKHLREKFPSIRVLNIFSDGAGSQFKQRFLFSNVHYWEQDHHQKLTWNIFATSHGKGVVEDLGGTVKRAVWRHVRSGQVHITADEYAKIAEQRNQKYTWN